MQAWRQVIVGYAMATIGLLVVLTTNGASATPTAVTISTSLVISVGILLPAAGMLQQRRAVDRDRGAARRGLAMQGFGLVGLLFGVLLLSVSSVLPVLFASAVLIVISGMLAIGGACLLRGPLILGTALIFAGAAVIVSSEIAYCFLLSDLEATISEDVGTAVAACGCVVAGCSVFGRSPASATRRAWEAPV